MAISKDDWGVKRVEKELASMTKILLRKWRGWTSVREIEGYYDHYDSRGRVESRALPADILAIHAKQKQLDQAKENWRLWKMNADYQVFVDSLAYLTVKLF